MKKIILMAIICMSFAPNFVLAETPAEARRNLNMAMSSVPPHMARQLVEALRMASTASPAANAQLQEAIAMSSSPMRRSPAARAQLQAAIEAISSSAATAQRAAQQSPAAQLRNARRAPRQRERR